MGKRVRLPLDFDLLDELLEQLQLGVSIDWNQHRSDRRLVLHRANRQSLEEASDALRPARKIAASITCSPAKVAKQLQELAILQICQILVTGQAEDAVENEVMAIEPVTDCSSE